MFAASTEVRTGDITRPEDIADAMARVDAVIFTHGSHGGADERESVDYGAVKERSYPCR
ncbi:Rossmann-fold NAD(P)-binding domain-containing protein [Sinorhizobium medicae]|uniref:NAD(P)H-binding protein n=1 Tax=Sinorhizobium medicae TaxID=110321 RepID=UPI002277ECAF|nr:NAD(P)H-binding protein [Sinorhizobium medicae]